MRTERLEAELKERKSSTAELEIFLEREKSRNLQLKAMIEVLEEEKKNHVHELATVRRKTSIDTEPESLSRRQSLFHEILKSKKSEQLSESPGSIEKFSPAVSIEDEKIAVWRNIEVCYIFIESMLLFAFGVIFLHIFLIFFDASLTPCFCIVPTIQDEFAAVKYQLT